MKRQSQRCYYGFLLLALGATACYPNAPRTAPLSESERGRGTGHSVYEVPAPEFELLTQRAKLSVDVTGAIAGYGFFDLEQTGETGAEAAFWSAGAQPDFDPEDSRWGSFQLSWAVEDVLATVRENGESLRAPAALWLSLQNCDEASSICSRALFRLDLSLPIR